LPASAAPTSALALTGGSIALLALLFVLAGVAIALVETAEHTAVAALAPVDLRGSAFGVLAAIQSLGNFAASAGDPNWSVGEHTIYADCGSRFAINAGFTNDTGSDNPAVITVLSAAGSEIFPDRYTRVKVAFHWDRQPAPTGEIDASAKCVPSSKPLP
jgi:hypothetical protein